MCFLSWNANHRPSARQTPISLSLPDERMKPYATLRGSLSRLADISTHICLELIYMGGNPPTALPGYHPRKGSPQPAEQSGLWPMGSFQLSLTVKPMAKALIFLEIKPIIRKPK